MGGRSSPEKNRAAVKRWKQNNPDKWKAIVAESRLKSKTKKQEFCDRWKLAAGCFDCGYNTAAIALDFDHLGDKWRSISKVANEGWSMRTLIAEIQKCVVRCANCHRIKTQERSAPGEG